MGLKIICNLLGHNWKIHLVVDKGRYPAHNKAEVIWQCERCKEKHSEGFSYQKELNFQDFTSMIVNTQPKPAKEK